MTESGGKECCRVRIHCGFEGPLTVEQLDRCMDQIHLVVRFGFNERPRYTDTGDGRPVETTYAHVVADLHVASVVADSGFEVVVVATSGVSAPVLRSGATFVQGVLDTCQLYYDLEEWASARLASESAVEGVSARVSSYVVPAAEKAATWQLLNDLWGLGRSRTFGTAGAEVTLRSRTPSAEPAVIASWVGSALMDIERVVIEEGDAEPQSAP